MTQVVLQPAASAAARNHLDRTIWNEVSIDDHRDVLVGDFQALRDLYPKGRAPMWGLTPGEDGSTGRWDRIEPGDVVLFTGNGRVFLRATVRYKFRNVDLARRLWGDDPTGRTWELMYAVDQLEKLDLPYAELNRLAGYAENNVVQGTAVLDQVRSARILEGLGGDGWELQPGDTIRRTELHLRYGGTGQSGISPSRKSANVFLFADPGSGGPHGYIHDRWVNDELFIYTGEGQSGDQQLTMGNKAIAEHRDSGRALRLFYGAGGIITYAGRFSIDAVTPYEWLEAPPSGGGELRKVLAFHLHPSGPAVRTASDFDAQWTALVEFLQPASHWNSLGEKLRYDVVSTGPSAINFSNAGGNAGKATKANLRRMWDSAKASPADGTGPRTRAAAALLALLPNIEYTAAPLRLFWGVRADPRSRHDS